MVKFEKYVADAHIINIIINKLSHWGKSNLIILLIVNKNPEISFHYTVLPFNLAVSLKIEGDKELLLDSQKVLKW